MRIVVIGVDHSTAPIELRERLACSLRQIPQLLQAARQVAQECVLLSTCNRVELYAVCADTDEEQAKAHLLHVLSEQRQVELTELEASCYYFTGQQAVAHLFGVAAGLHSPVPGEPQIQGQVAEALQVAQGGRFAGPITSALFRAALVTGKRARSETGISRNAASVSHVAVHLARQLFPRLNDACVLLVGSGKMSELAARNLCDNGARRLVIISRTKEHAIELAERYGTIYRSFSELEESLAEADVVISSTTAPRAVITLELMQRVLPRRAGRPLLLIDIALPRDVDPQVATLPDVHVYNLDDVQAAVDEGVRLRAQEAKHVKAIIAEETDAFERWLRSLSVVDTISDLRRQVEQVRQQELARAMRQLAPTLSEREAAIIRDLTTRITGKLLHTPTLRLKEAAASGQGDIYAEALRYLFGLEEIDGTDNEDHHRDASQQTGDDPDGTGHRAAASLLADAGNSH